MFEFKLPNVMKSLRFPSFPLNPTDGITLFKVSAVNGLFFTKFTAL